jgi:hypothetical protein
VTEAYQGAPRLERAVPRLPAEVPAEVPSRGDGGLEPWSRKAANQPRRMPATTKKKGCRLRRTIPSGTLGGSEPSSPARGSTPGDVFDPRCPGAQQPGGAQNRGTRPATKRFERASPNDLWQIDFIHLLMADEGPVPAMNIPDGHARFGHPTS